MFIAGMFILLGAIVNILIAWTCAAFVNYDKATEQIIYTVAWDEGGYFSDARRTRPGFTQSIQRLMRPGEHGVGGRGYTLQMPNAVADNEVVLLRPKQTLREVRPDVHDRAVKGELKAGVIAIWPWQTSAGWPMRSMACWHENLVGVPSRQFMATDGPVTITRGMEIRRGDGAFGPCPSRAYVLPFQPLWGGFIVNTLFYALLAGLLFFGGREFRRRWRLRRGLCPQCKYPIGVSPVCTECGAPLPGVIGRSSA